MESFGIIVDCVSLAFTTYCFVVLLELGKQLEKMNKRDKRFDKIYEKSTCPPKTPKTPKPKSKPSFWTALSKKSTIKH